eukprot:1055935-Rhodomonas_salina.1
MDQALTSPESSENTVAYCVLTQPRQNSARSNPFRHNSRPSSARPNQNNTLKSAVHGLPTASRSALAVHGLRTVDAIRQFMDCEQQLIRRFMDCEQHLNRQFMDCGPAVLQQGVASLRGVQHSPPPYTCSRNQSKIPTRSVHFVPGMRLISPCSTTASRARRGQYWTSRSARVAYTARYGTTLSVPARSRYGKSVPDTA